MRRWLRSVLAVGLFSSVLPLCSIIGSIPAGATVTPLTFNCTNQQQPQTSYYTVTSGNSYTVTMVNCAYYLSQGAASPLTPGGAYIGDVTTVVTVTGNAFVEPYDAGQGTGAYYNVHFTLAPSASVAVTSSNSGTATEGVATTYTATVSSSGTTPTGSVTFYDGSTAICSTVSLTSGVATCAQTYNSLTGSPHTITASYSGDGNYAAVANTADASHVTETVYLPDTVSVSSSDNGSGVVAVPTTYTATVSASSGTPTGSATFYDGSTAICSTVTLVNAVATCSHTYTSTSGSPHTITASYTGDGTYLPVAHTADTATVTETEAAATSSVAVSSSNSGTASEGVATTYTATVTGAGTTPTGTVTFYDGSTAICSTVSLSSGVATCIQTYNSLTGSPHTITASYTGDSNYNAVVHTADATSVTETVYLVASVTVSSSDNGSGTVGAPTTYTATVSGSSGTPSGSVTFYDGSTAICSTVSLTSGVATCAQTYNSTSGSPRTITASYTGDGTYLPVAHTADANSVSESVGTATAAVNVTSSDNGSASIGIPTTYTATVTGAGTTPTGSVTFYDGSTAICSTVSLTGGVAHCVQTYNSLTGSPHTITASYTGDGNYNAVVHTGDQTSVSEMVHASPSVTVSSSNNGSGTVGVPTTYTATVSGTSGTPSGSVTFYDGSTAICSTVSLTSGVATCAQTYNSTTGSPHTITASYTGDGNYGAIQNNADATSVVESVGVGTASVAVTSSDNGSVVVGAAVTYTATVTGAGVTPTGTVTFYDGSTAICSTVSLTGGVATCAQTYNSTTGSPHIITASYTGDGSYGAVATNADTTTVSQGVTINAPRRSTPTTTLNAQSTLLVTSTHAPVGTALSLSTSGGSGAGAVTFILLSTGSADCVLVGDVLTASRTGSCSIEATKAGSSSYSSVTSAPTVENFIVTSVEKPKPWASVLGPFENGSSSVSDVVMHEVTRLGEVIRTNRYHVVVLDGFASMGGPESLNEQLSVARALHVASLLKAWLSRSGVTGVAIYWVGKGVTDEASLGTGRVVAAACRA